MNNFKLLVKLLHYVGKHKVKIYYLIFLSLLGVGFEVLKPLPIKFIVDNVLSDHALSPGMIAFFNSFGGVPGKIPLLSICIGAMVIFVIGSACVSIYVSHLTTKVCQTMVHELSLDLFDKVQRLSLSFYSKNKVGELLQRISGDV
ncbi:MAG: ABC transporter transmembrane domain-containing protein, partial [Segetibacter sp.]